MLSPIVVPLDGSLLSERALRPAKVLAQAWQAELVLVRVVNPVPEVLLLEPSLGITYPEPTPDEAQREAAAYLETLRSACVRDGLTVHTLLRTDEDVANVPNTILEVARQVQAGLILMSSHGYSGLQRWVFGSVAERVLAGASCPVFVVRAPLTIGHVLVTLDGSPLAEQVLAPALAVARGLGAKVTLLRCVPPPSVSDIFELESLERGMGQRFVEETEEATAAAYLAGIVARWDDGTTPLVPVVRSGPAAQTILDYVRNHAVDLIAMTTHGRTGLQRLVYGSVTRQVLNQLPVSMLIAHPPAHAQN